MRVLSALVPLLVTCLLARSDAEVVGTINVEGVGTIYVWKSFGNIVIEDNGFRVSGNSRGYLLSKDPGGSLTPDAFWQTNLFDQRHGGVLPVVPGAVHPGHAAALHLLTKRNDQMGQRYL